MTAPRRKTAVILSGGGARGAYEVGVLSYVFDELARIRGAAPRVDILSGTSVGAINACYLAAHLENPTIGIRRLVDLWHGIRLDEILGFGPRHVMALPRVLTGGLTDGAGVFDVTPIANLVKREIAWRAIARTLRHGHLEALSVSTTDVRSGRTVIFMQTGPRGSLPTTAPPRVTIRAERIGPPHALASAAIPILFPPVRIGNALYFDGGVRQNTPIAPALRLGATHIFAIGLSREERGVSAVESGAAPRAPSAAFILGKVLNASLLDHINTDLEVLRRINGMLEDSERAFGPTFTDRLNDSVRARGGAPYRKVAHLTVRPTEDIGRMAADQIRSGKFRGGSMVVRRILSLLDVGDSESDLVSYLLFDGAFASRLIDLGRADAAARRDELLAFFGDGKDDGPPPEPSGDDESGYSIVPPPPIVG